MSQAFSLTKTATDLLANLGYAGVGLTLFVDSFGIPIPSEVVLPLAGALIRSGRMSLLLVLLVAVASQTLGGLAGYLVGRYGGVPFLEKYGRYLLISKGDLAYTRRTFEKYGKSLVVVGRCLPVIRGLVGYPAGIAEMNEGVFIIFTALGSLMWSAVLIYAGYALGGQAGQIDHIVNRFSIVIIVLILAAAAHHIYHYLKTNR